MTNKEYLSRPYRLEKTIEAKTRRLCFLQSLVEGSNPMTTDKIQATPSPTRFEDMMVKIIDLKDSIQKDKESLVLYRSEVSSCISELTDPRYSAVLEFRYLLYMSWEDIIVQTNYCRSYVYELHGRALKHIKQKT